ncbi:MAG: hypothetical protein K2M76_00500 [Muribaculaceae bacterium]|nr:hypothetical protein [Muribaculaceae bacterium]
MEEESSKPTLPVWIAARILSWVFSPLLIPVYSVFITLWGSPLAFLPMRSRLGILTFTFIATGVFPMLCILGLKFSGQVTSAALRERTERTIPYIIAALCYSFCIWHFHRAMAPDWFCMFFAGATLSIVAVAIINLWWKISGHATAVGGMLGLCLWLAVTTGPEWPYTSTLTGVILICGVTCTSRLLLGRHTPAQVWSGLALGFAAVYLTATLFA